MERRRHFAEGPQADAKTSVHNSAVRALRGKPTIRLEMGSAKANQLGCRSQGSRELVHSCLAVRSDGGGQSGRRFQDFEAGAKRDVSNVMKAHGVRGVPLFQLELEDPPILRAERRVRSVVGQRRRSETSA